MFLLHLCSCSDKCQILLETYNSSGFQIVFTSIFQPLSFAAAGFDEYSSVEKQMFVGAQCLSLCSIPVQNVQDYDGPVSGLFLSWI